MNSFRLPKHDQRISICGHTGSGKTMFAAWVLSHAPLHAMPYIIIDYKGDPFLNSIQKVRHARLDRKPPHQPGLHIVHPVPSEENEIEDYMWQIWERGKTGVYVDEAHMLPVKGALQALLTQGRSKKIPMIVLTQRPVWTSRFVFSEADYYTVFHLNFPDDQKFVSGLIGADIRRRLPPYHLRYHIVQSATTYVLKPVPHPDKIRKDIEGQLRPNTLWG